MSARRTDALSDGSFVTRESRQIASVGFSARARGHIILLQSCPCPHGHVV